SRVAMSAAAPLTRTAGQRSDETIYGRKAWVQLYICRVQRAIPCYRCGTSSAGTCNGYAEAASRRTRRHANSLGVPCSQRAGFAHGPKTAHVSTRPRPVLRASALVFTKGDVSQPP